jgi:hypothetical protein
VVHEARTQVICLENLGASGTDLPVLVALQAIWETASATGSIWPRDSQWQDGAATVRRMRGLSGWTTSRREKTVQASCDCTFAKRRSAGADVRRSAGYWSLCGGHERCMRSSSSENSASSKEP